MKKLWILAIVLFAASAAVMAQDAVAEDELFAGIDAVALDVNLLPTISGGGIPADTCEDGFPTVSKGGIVENPFYIDDYEKLCAMGYLARSAQRILDVESTIEDFINPIKNINNWLNRFFEQFTDW